ncbi:MAG: hypothetical protein WC378_13770 [Opitutaceae bacterium]|jgi:hypothetical protein
MKGTYKISRLDILTLCAVCVFIALKMNISLRHPEAMPSPLALQVVIQEQPVGGREPLLCAGEPGRGVFLYLVYKGNSTACIGYDSWGSGGPTSAPFTFSQGQPMRLDLELPSLDAAVAKDRPRTARLKVQVNGSVLLNEEVKYHVTPLDEVYYGINPLGGSSCSSLFSGSIFTEHSSLHGKARPAAGRLERLNWWCVNYSSPILTVLASFIIIAFLIRLLGALKDKFQNLPILVPACTRKAHAAFAVALMLCVWAFSHFITYGSYSFFKEENFGTFYDYQAQSLLQGRLDVPEAALGGEAFVFQGRIYGYFGPTPALLRIPFVLAKTGVGMLSRSFMLGYFVAVLVFTYQILRLCYRRLRGAGTEPPSWAVVCITLSTGLGSTLFFLSSRGYIYHEAILCGSAFAFAGAYFALRFLGGRSRPDYLISLICGILSVQARPPTGLFALGLLACCSVWPLCDSLLQQATLRLSSLRSSLVLISRSWRQLLAAFFCVTGVLTFNLLGYLKFRDFGGCPLKYHVQYTPERLANIEGKAFHLANIPFCFNTYVTVQNFSVTRDFPFYYIGGGYSPSYYFKPRIDVAEPTVAFPWAMPSLFMLASLGSVYVLLRAPRLLPYSAVLWVALLPMSLAMFCAAAVSQRYTADFCTFLVCASCVSLAALSGCLERLRRTVIVIVFALTLLSILITYAITIQNQGAGVWGVPDEVPAHYKHLKKQMNELFSPLFIKPR